MKALQIIMYVIAILLMVAVVAGVIYAWSTNYKNESIKNEIIEHLKSDTEDEGDYVIRLEECTEYKLSEYPKAKVFYAWMTDADGDTSMKIVRYVAPNDIESFNVWWESAR